jgi:hypothetical protein
MKFLMPSFLAATALLCGFVQSAQAYDYSSRSGSTTLELMEGGGNDGANTGHYLTQAQGGDWGGFIKLTEGQGAMGHYYYKGTFADSPLSEVRVPPDSRTTCTGDVSLVRSNGGRFSNRMTMTVTWKVTGGRRCESIGKTFQVNLSQK